MKFVAALAATLMAAYEVASAAPRVNVHQFVMAKCPMSTTLHTSITRQLMSKPGLREIVNFTQSFVGSPVGEGGDDLNQTNWMQCFHGPSECYGHAVMLCAEHVSTRDHPFDYRWYDMVSCMNGVGGLPGVTDGTTASIPEDASGCAKKVGLDWDDIVTCAGGQQDTKDKYPVCNSTTDSFGCQMLHDSHFLTQRMFAAHGGYTPPGHGYNPPKIPVVWIDGTEYSGYYHLSKENNPYKNLVSKICNAYSGEAPSACADHIATENDGEEYAALWRDVVLAKGNAIDLPLQYV